MSRPIRSRKQAKAARVIATSRIRRARIAAGWDDAYPLPVIGDTEAERAWAAYWETVKNATPNGTFDYKSDFIAGWNAAIASTGGTSD